MMMPLARRIERCHVALTDSERAGFQGFLAVLAGCVRTVDELIFFHEPDLLE